MKKLLLTLFHLEMTLTLISGGAKQSLTEFYDRDVLGGDTSKLAQTVANGVEFRFYLLNENSMPSTTFQKGENFYFYFSIKNTGTENLGLGNEFLYQSTFCKVKDNSNSYGYPFESVGIAKVSSEARPLNPGQEYIIVIPWMNSSDSWEVLNCTFKSAKQKPLPKGKYYTEFTSSFTFNRPDKTKFVTDSLTFKVKFAVK